ncbi:MAG: hypothetical protein CMJ78_03880 [Planctomycetaceae bacterium]|nr:hypothetical protein [Planctomycetaceae bacterium]
MGRLLVVVQVILAVCFMAFAGAVFSVQTSWKEKATNLDQQLTTEKDEYERLNKDYEALKTDTNEQIKNLTDSETGLKVERDNLTRELEDKQNKLNEEIKASDTQREVARIATLEAEERRKEAVELRKQNKKLHDQNNALAAIKRALEDEIFNLDVKEQNTIQRQERLVAELAKLRNLVRQANVSDGTMNVADVKEPPPLVEGRVTETKRGLRNGNDLIAFSLGSDDGIQLGHGLSVYRTGDKQQGRRPKYLGEIKVVHVTPDRAVGEVVLKAKNGVIEKGDNVTTKL